MPDPPKESLYKSDNRGETIGYAINSQNMTNNYSTLPYASYSTSSSKSSFSPKNYGGTIDSNFLNDNNEPITVKKETTKRREETLSFDINFGESYDRIKGNQEPFSPSGNIQFIDEDIPYHARQTSQPFTYGATSDMIKQKILSSPSLVRKVSVRTTGSTPVTKNIQEINIERENRDFVSPTTPDPPPEFANVPPTANIKQNEYSDG